jgi:phosphoglycerate dehydrogenase-like enzyme
MDMSGKPQALLVMDHATYLAHFDEARLKRLRDLVTPSWTSDLDSPIARGRLKRAELLVTSWGAPALTATRLDAAPAVRAVFHAAGSVRPLVTDDLWRRGIPVTSAADANAIPVAEFTLAAVIFAGKKAPFLAADPATAQKGWGHHTGFGDLSNYGRTVGVVGFSRIGRRVVRLLDCLHPVRRLVADPYAEATEVTRAGAHLVTLDALLKQSHVLTLHAPETDGTRGMIGARELALLPDHATVINTARGGLIDTAALVDECRTGRLFAILDVSEPEPLPPDHPLRTLPNVMITPHVAGSLGSEILRLTDSTLDEIARWRAAQPLRFPVTPETLSLSA